MLFKHHSDGVFTHKALEVVLFIVLQWSELDLSYHHDHNLLS